MNSIRQDILKVLAYFDYFSYPLTAEDIRSFLSQRCSQSSIDSMLSTFISEKVVFKLANFYSLQNEPGLAIKRQAGNQRAVKELVIARKVASVLSRFPYVKTIAISGSLSKHFADEKSDIDFFIITSANRLWIARTLMHLLKKISYIRGKQHWFCMNYFVDEAGMNIPEKNIFTAMEIVTLLPMQGANDFKAFIAANSWIENYFPARVISTGDAPEIKKGIARKCFEKVFNASFGDSVDKWLMNLTDKRWKKKALEGRVNDHGRKIGMVVDPHFSKPDPKNFQVTLVEKYNSRVNALLQETELQPQHQVSYHKIPGKAIHTQ